MTPHASAECDDREPDAAPRVYLDFQATTPTDLQVWEAMQPHFLEEFGNAHSSGHAWGLRAASAVAQAAEDVAMLLNAAPEDIVFTSGATEANNLALRGLLPARGKARIITCATEHASVSETANALKRDGHTVVRLSVGADGLIDLEVLDRELENRTTLVSIMAANSEIGVLQPIADIASLCAAREVPFHTDAVQAFGRIPLDVRAMGIGLVSVSAHKIYGPKGIGALYVAPALRSRLRPLMTGGGQQGGLRAGTVPTPLAVGFGVAARLMRARGPGDEATARVRRDALLDQLQARVDGVHLNGSAEHRLAGNLNIRIDGVDADSLLMLLPEIGLSTGSACHSRALAPSPVLMALGLSRDEAASSIRLSVGRTTTDGDIEYAVERLSWAIRVLRE